MHLLALLHSTKITETSFLALEFQTCKRQGEVESQDVKSKGHERNDPFEGAYAISIILCICFSILHNLHYNH